MSRDTCKICGTDLAREETITAINGILVCNRCAVSTYKESELFDNAEEVVPLDIGIGISSVDEWEDDVRQSYGGKPVTAITLEQMLRISSDSTLLEIYAEIDSQLVPTKGAAHSYCRRVNQLIDAGHMCINHTTYRKLYLPTLVKAVLKELARRYVENERMNNRPL